MIYNDKPSSYKNSAHYSGHKMSKKIKKTECFAQKIKELNKKHIKQ